MKSKTLVVRNLASLVEEILTNQGELKYIYSQI